MRIMSHAHVSDHKRSSLLTHALRLFEIWTTSRKRLTFKKFSHNFLMENVFF